MVLNVRISQIERFPLEVDKKISMSYFTRNVCIVVN
jgi:hypothetical protein